MNKEFYISTANKLQPSIELFKLAKDDESVAVLEQAKSDLLRCSELQKDEADKLFKEIEELLEDFLNPTKKFRALVKEWKILQATPDDHSTERAHKFSGLAKNMLDLLRTHADEIDYDLNEEDTEQLSGFLRFMKTFALSC